MIGKVSPAACAALVVLGRSATRVLTASTGQSRSRISAEAANQIVR